MRRTAPGISRHCGPLSRRDRVRRPRVTARGTAAWLLAAASPACARAQATATSDAGDNFGAASVLLAIVLMPLLLFLVRRRLVRRVQQQMMIASSDAAADHTGDSVKEEALAAAPLGFTCHTADLATTGGSEARQRRERAALQLFRRVSLADLGIALGYVMLPLVFGLFNVGQAAAIGVGVAAAAALYTFARYLIHRRQYQAFDLSRSRRRQRIMGRIEWVWRGLLVLITLGTGATAINLVYVPDILRGLFGARMRTLLCMALITIAGATGIATLFGADSLAARSAGAGLMLAALVHAGVFWSLGRRLREVKGLRLLILRVFNIEATSSFLFSGLTRYWRHFGNHFTIVDAALVRQGYSNSTWAQAFILVGGFALLVILALTAQSEFRLQHWAWAFAVVGGPALAAAAVVLAIGQRRIDARFTRSHRQLLQRLHSLERHPRHFDLSFRHARALCHDNTWFPAVTEFASRSDAVLMDLRGYTPERKGCQREVDFLFDAVPLARLLFLVDTATDESAVRDLLLKRWAMQALASPNLHLRDPVVQLYVSVDNDERDMQAILDRLIEIADHPNADHVGGVSRGADAGNAESKLTA